MTDPRVREPVARTGSALATVCGWHLLLAVAFVGWVLTWPDRVGTGGALNLTTSRTAMAIVLGVLLVAPALAVSLAIACGVLAALRRRASSGAVAGTLASLAGLATVGLALTVYALTR
jgi:hypothetical protein